MASSVTDLLDRVTDSTTGRPVIGTLAAPGKAIGAASINLADATNWTTTTGIHFSIFATITVAGITVKDPTTQTDWKGTLAGLVISNLTITGGTDRTYTTGAIVELTPTARYAKDLYDWGIGHANPDGTLKTSAVQAALNIGTTSPDWTPLATIPSLNSSNGQREYQFKFSGVDYTDRLQPGTKLKIPRTSTAPTQSAAFVAASSQYASKASPAGMTFTSAFTCEAWIYLNSYPSGQVGIISRDATTSAGSGFEFGITSSGQLTSFYRNATGASATTSYQSIPLKRWVHVATTVTTATPSGYAFYVDGVSVPTNTNATAATSLVQSTAPLTIGDRSGSAHGYFDGFIMEGRVWSVAQTQQQIRDNMNKLAVGNETNLVACYHLNGNFNDSTANANNLTASGGAIATNAANPMNATEYGIVTAVTKPAADTLVTVFTPTGTGIPNETLGTVSYSSARTPYGFPSSKNRWSVESWLRYLPGGQTGTGAWTQAGVGFGISIPTGEWMVTSSLNYQQNNTTAGVVQLFSSLSASTSTETDSRFTSYLESAPSVTTASTVSTKSADLSITTMTNYNAIAKSTGGSGTITYYIRGDFSPSVIRAECAYL